MKPIHPFAVSAEAPANLDGAGAVDDGERSPLDQSGLDRAGSVVDMRTPQALFPDETLEHALRQLVPYGPDGRPVLSGDRSHLISWAGRPVPPRWRSPDGSERSSPTPTPSSAGATTSPVMIRGPRDAHPEPEESPRDASQT